MSLKSFLESIWAKLKSLFSDMPEELKTAVHIAVVITDGVKNFDDKNPEVADLLTAIIPGTLDDEIKNKLRLALPDTLIKLKLVDATLGLTDPNAIIANAIQVIQTLDPNIKAAFLHDLSILVAMVAADGKLTWSDAVYVLQWYYQHEYTPAS